jgi:protein ImuA
MPHFREPAPARAGAALEGERHHVLARLRDEIRRIERRPGRREGNAPCGLAAVNAALPGGGFPRGALSELCGGPASGKTAVALSLLAALPSEEPFAWVDGRRELYPPAAAACGVDLGRLLVVRPPLSAEGLPPPGVEPPWRSALWAAEALLGSGAFSAVAIDVALPRAIAGADALARRIQAAAERGGAVGLWLSTPPAAFRVPAAVRLDVWSEGGRIAARRACGGERARGGGRAA